MRIKILKNILNKKECRDVLTGRRFEWDYNQRVQIEKMEQVIFDFRCQLNEIDWGEADANDKYRSIDKRIKKIQTSITQIEKALEENIKFELLIVRLDEEYKTLHNAST